MKKYFRCIVCGDLHYGELEPKICPTCMQENVYVKCEEKEFFLVSKSKNIDKHNELENKWEYEDVKNNFIEFCDKNKQFILNPEKEHTDIILNGILENQKKKGLKLCPCRLEDKGTFKEKVSLICPCNFFIQEPYKEKKRDTKQCWCGLFIKVEK